MPWLSWRTSPRRCIEDVRLFVNPRHWLTWPCSVVFIAVYNKCVILLLKWVTLNAAPCRRIIVSNFHAVVSPKVIGFVFVISCELLFKRNILEATTSDWRRLGYTGCGQAKQTIPVQAWTGPEGSRNSRYPNLNGSITMCLWRSKKLNSVCQHNHFIAEGNYKATCFDYRLVILRPILLIVSQDAMQTLGYHHVYIRGIHQIQSFVSKGVTCKLCLQEWEYLTARANCVYKSGRISLHVQIVLTRVGISHCTWKLCLQEWEYLTARANCIYKSEILPLL